MTPIINPWVFYLISVADSIVGISIALSVISVIIFVGAAFFAVMMLGDYDRESFMESEP